MALAALALATLLLALLLRRPAGPPAAWRELAARTGADLRGDGTVEPLRLFGVHRGRRWTLVAQAEQVALAVDCATTEAGPVPLGEGVATPDDGALVVRIHPLDPSRVETLLDALVELAEALERRAPAPPDVD